MRVCLRTCDMQKEKLKIAYWQGGKRKNQTIRNRFPLGPISTGSWTRVVRYVKRARSTVPLIATRISRSNCRLEKFFPPNFSGAASLFSNYKKKATNGRGKERKWPRLLHKYGRRLENARAGLRATTVQRTRLFLTPSSLFLQWQQPKTNQQPFWATQQTILRFLYFTQSIISEKVKVALCMSCLCVGTVLFADEIQKKKEHLKVWTSEEGPSQNVWHGTLTEFHFCTLEYICYFTFCLLPTVHNV